VEWRPDLRVLARCLDCLAKRDALMLRSHLARAAGAKYDIVRRYVAYLQAKGLLVVEGDEPRIRITAAGRQWRDRLLAWLTELFGAL